MCCLEPVDAVHCIILAMNVGPIQLNQRARRLLRFSSMVMLTSVME